MIKMNSQDLTLLTEGQIWGNSNESQLEVIRKYGTKAAITTGSYLCKDTDYNIDEDRALTGRTSWFWTRSDDGDNRRDNMDYIKYINQLSLVSTRINELLSDGHFELSQEYLRYIHKYLFKDIYPSNGEYRTYDLIKNEMTLNEKSVIYASYNTIETYLKYDLAEEKKVNYSKLSKEVQVKK